MSAQDEVVEQYIASWNETDPARRRELIARTFTADASYLDPQMAGEGTDGIDAMIAAVQERFPGYRFTLAGAPDGYADRLRFSWHLDAPQGDGPVAIGHDFARVADDGRLAEVCGFLEAA